MLENGVILAGGKSSRMGRDKALMPFAGHESMAEYQYRRLEKVFKNVYISAKENKFNFDAKIIKDRYKESSPMVAIYSALKELKSDFFLISVDLPLLSQNAIESLINLYENNSGYDIYLLKSKNGIEPTAAIYTINLLAKIEELLNRDIHKLNTLISSSNILLHRWDNLQDFINVNNQEEYKMACAIKEF